MWFKRSLQCTTLSPCNTWKIEGSCRQRRIIWCTPNRSIGGIWLPLRWTSIGKVACLWFQYSYVNIDWLIIRSKEQKYTLFTVFGKELSSEFQQGLFWGYHYLIYFSVIHFIKWKIQTLEVTQMIKLLIQKVTSLMM